MLHDEEPKDGLDVIRVELGIRHDVARVDRVTAVGTAEVRIVLPIFPAQVVQDKPASRSQKLLDEEDGEAVDRPVVRTV